MSRCEIFFSARQQLISQIADITSEFIPDLVFCNQPRESRCYYRGYCMKLNRSEQESEGKQTFFVTLITKEHTPYS